MDGYVLSLTHLSTDLLNVACWQNHSGKSMARFCPFTPNIQLIHSPSCRWLCQFVSKPLLELIEVFHSCVLSMYGVMGIANAQRTLTYLRIITEFVSQDNYRDVVGMSVFILPPAPTQVLLFTPYHTISVGIVNEILWGTIGQTPVQSFYLAAYEEIRKAT